MSSTVLTTINQSYWTRDFYRWFYGSISPIWRLHITDFRHS